MNLHRLLETISHAYSGEAAWQTVCDLSRLHRIQASPGYRQAAQLVYQGLRRDGIAAEILSYPADEQTQFWAWPSFQEWSCTEATLHHLAPDGARLLADFRACPMSVIQRSAPFEGEAEVVLLQDGEEEGNYGGLDVAGKVVLTRGDIRRVYELAVRQRGAAGILYDGMRPVMPVRPEGELADVRQYTSFWWQAGDPRCFGFVLTPRQGRELRRLLHAREAPVRVAARVASRLYDGTIEVVSAAIPGPDPAEIVVVAHLCHPQPSANDNASGAAAALEAARALQTLVARGDLPAPRRTIRFLWLPEMTGTYAYLAGREADLAARRLIAGINLDMVGEDQGQTGSSWLIEAPPAAAASFAPDLLARLRAVLPSLKGTSGASSSHTGQGAYPLYRHAETPFSGGSDHAILSDPTVGVPTPMLIQWPDRFYHTSADTPDRTDPNSLHRAGVLAAAYAYWLAAAGATETTWLGYEMAARFRVLLAEKAQAAITAALELADGEEIARTLAALDRDLSYQLGRHRAAVRSLERLGPAGCLVADLEDEGERTVLHSLRWARQGLDLQAVRVESGAPGGSGGAQAAPLSAPEQEAAALVPVRRVPGPIPVRDHLRRLPGDERERWRQAIKAHAGSSAHSLTELALYWADGARSILDIADLVELEAGRRDVELILGYFRLLERLELVTLR